MTDIDADTLDAIASDLEDAIGRERAVTSSELAARHLPDDGDANPATREAVKTLMRERGLPVIGCSEGYYIPEHSGPIEDAVDSLEGRINGIRERQQLLEDNWRAWSPASNDQRETATDGSGEVVDSYTPHDDGDDAEHPTGLTDDERERIENDPFLTVADVLEVRGE